MLTTAKWRLMCDISTKSIPDSKKLDAAPITTASNAIQPNHSLPPISLPRYHDPSSKTMQWHLPTISRRHNAISSPTAFWMDSSIRELSCREMGLILYGWGLCTISGGVFGWILQPFWLFQSQEFKSEWTVSTYKDFEHNYRPILLQRPGIAMQDQSEEV
jgi:hypothetical protein